MIFRFLGIEGGLIWSRRLHLFAAHWGLILMSVHLGLHWKSIMDVSGKMLHLNEKSQARTRVSRVAAALLSLCGVVAFIQQKMPEYLFLKAHFVFFDEQKPAVLHFADYISMIVLFAAAGYYLILTFNKKL